MMDFVCNMLKKDKNVAFRDVQEAGSKKGFTIFPIVYGRAKALLGLVPTAPRGQGKAGGKRRPGRPAKTTATLPARRGPGRPRRVVSALDSLDSLVSAMKQSEGARERYRRALEQALGIIKDAL